MNALPTPKSRILGTGHYVPEKVLANVDLEKMVDTSDAWIAERTGIRRRHIAAEHENTSDMAAAAARRALESAGLNAADIDMIIVGTISGDSPMPACAVHVQQKLGADNIPAFDVSAACAGFIYGLTIADQFIATGAARCVLVVGVELLSRLLDWQDRTTCVLFGDGAGAVVLGPSEGDGRGLLATRIFTDGSLAHALTIPGGGTAEPLTDEGLAKKRNKVHMMGQEIFRTAIKNLTSASTAVLKASGLTSAELDWVVAHQANLRIITQVADRLNFPMEKFVINIQEYGNTSSASIPIALDEAVRDGRIKPGQNVLMCALGAGISWGAALVRM
ncbi:beta-ketoacyl-ACP synthase III [Polyangium jinanense]|uniref:Beta-ketoacyl-[acyl-carrier-protein] synthase III n=1 Tax=Polyangium jinanense TaxID=2829994 RepID=A0A9X4AY06_9BACT|nr:beta-ketoacyl-ACP synthase III [Polyangium jinanense]MDC3957130.1 ketoacyl-ACP synthase III [Polyangium jinanense]MDC3986840.1 ketoacyl-ACP synthase III [Polyangium jinanense]